MADNRKPDMPDENVYMDPDVADILDRYDALNSDPSLESILSEFKSNPYAESAKKPAPAASEPVAETVQPTPAQGETPKVEHNRDEIDRWFDEFVPSSKREEKAEEPRKAKKSVKEKKEPVSPEPEKKSEGAAFDNWNSLDFSNPVTVDKFAKELSEAMEKESIVNEPIDDEDYFPRRRRYRTAARREEYAEEETPDAEVEALRFARPLRSLTARLIGAGIICLLMTVFTFVFSAGKPLPFGIDSDQTVFTAVLLILQCTVMLAGIDVLVSGCSDLLRLRPSGESLILISGIMTLVDGFMMFVKENTALGLPFCLVSAWAVFFAMFGRRAYYCAMRDSLHMSAASASPFGVISEDNVDDRKILKKISGQTDGFYAKLTQADSSESAYELATPLLVLASFIFAFLASVGQGRDDHFAHCFAIMLAVSAAFPACMAFSLPFRHIARHVKHFGAAIAGWGGACEIADSDSAIITDDDIFPKGTLSLSNAKMISSNVSQSKAIIYTSSLVIASKSGLAKVFDAFLKESKLTPVNIENFACYEGGGIGALIDGERVLVGSGAFMNLMGIRVPENINLNNSVFTAINDELIVVFSINYIPANSVQNAFASILNTRVDLLLAVRDFNITPNMIQHKFKVSMEGVKIIPAEMSYKVSEETVPDGKTTSAILCREGLAPFAETIAGGRLLKKITDVNTVVSIAGSVIGLLLMFFLCWSASYVSASVKNVFIFMFVIEACVMLLSRIVKQRI